MRRPDTTVLLRTALSIGAVLAVAIALRHEFKPRPTLAEVPDYRAGYVSATP